MQQGYYLASWIAKITGRSLLRPGNRLIFGGFKKAKQSSNLDSVQKGQSTEVGKLTFLTRIYCPNLLKVRVCDYLRYYRTKQSTYSMRLLLRPGGSCLWFHSGNRDQHRRSDGIREPCRVWLVLMLFSPHPPGKGCYPLRQTTSILGIRYWQFGPREKVHLPVGYQFLRRRKPPKPVGLKCYRRPGRTLGHHSNSR